MRRLLFSLLALSTITGVAFAHAPTVALDPIGPLSYATFPQLYSVTGTVSHDSPGNVSAVSELKLWINGVQEGATVNPNYGNTTSAPFALPWSITAPGTYTVMVTAKHGNSTGSDSEDVDVSEIILPPVVITECPAAPALANAYLKALNIKSGSAQFKNVISLVAQHMETGASFDGIAACDMAPYASAVQSFVASALASPTPKK